MTPGTSLTPVAITRDAQGLYAQFGFRAEGELPKKPYPSVRMGLLRRSP